jgi:hypothetical protein
MVVHLGEELARLVAPVFHAGVMLQLALHIDRALVTAPAVRGTVCGTTTTRHGRDDSEHGACEEQGTRPFSRRRPD